MFDVLLSDQAQGSFITLALLTLIKLISVSFGDGNKRLDTKLATKRLEIEADNQESLQDERLAPIWQKMLKSYEDRVLVLEGKLEAFQTNHLILAVQYAELKQNAAFMEARVAELERQLALSKEKHISDEKAILDLEVLIENQNIELLHLTRQLVETQTLLESARQLTRPETPPEV